MSRSEEPLNKGPEAENFSNDGAKNAAIPDPALMRAIALKYEPEISNAPRVVAAGTGYMAQRILQVAAENNIAVYHDDSTATLLSKLELGQEIPPELYQIVVNIYIYLLTLANAKK
jgi:flagellar biosynthesis protein